MDEVMKITDKILDCPVVTENDLAESIDVLLDDDQNPDAGQMLVMYILQKHYKSGKTEITTQEIVEQTKLLMSERILENLTNIGLIEAHIDSEIEYKLTPEGKKITDGISSNG